MVKMIIVWSLAALFLLNSISITLRSNRNTGTLLMWGASALLVLYGLFHRRIDTFCASGVGLALKIAFFAALLAFIGLMVFLGVMGGRHSALGNEAAIIVLGAGLRRARVGDILRRRLQAGLDAYRQNPAALLVVSGGQGPQETTTEADAMRLWLLEQGVPQDAILAEDKSVSTETNLLYSAALLAERGIDKTRPIAIVTNRFHCYRAGVYARRLGYTNARLIPASMNLNTFLPNYMREALAILYMWVFRKGTAR